MGIVVSYGQTHSVTSGQTETGDVVNNGGNLVVQSGGAISGTQENGSVVISAGGTGNGTFISSNGAETVYGLAIGTVVNYGLQYVEGGGTASGTTLSGSNGIQYVNAGG